MLPTVFLASLHQTVVGTALPTIVTALNGASLYAWVVSAYLLSSTVTVPISGKFSDVFGRKVMLTIGVPNLTASEGGKCWSFRTLSPTPGT
jgi:MFS family permease